MKKIMILMLLIMVSGLSYSNEVVKGIKWNMSKSEVKKILEKKEFREERSDELNYKYLEVTDDRLDLQQVADLVVFLFKDDRLVSIRAAITKARYDRKINDFYRTMLKCSEIDGAVRVPSETKLAIVNKKYKYGCSFDSTDEELRLFVIYND